MNTVNWLVFLVLQLLNYNGTEANDPLLKRMKIIWERVENYKFSTQKPKTI
jgi:hypothetical protein